METTLDNHLDSNLVSILQDALKRKPTLLWLDSSKYSFKELQNTLNQLDLPCDYRHWEPLQGQLPSEGEQSDFFSEKLLEGDIGTEFIHYLLNLRFERTRNKRFVWVPLLETILITEKDKKTALYLHGFLEEQSLDSLCIVAPIKNKVQLQTELGFLSEHENCQMLAQ